MPTKQLVVVTQNVSSPSSMISYGLNKLSSLPEINRFIQSEERNGHTAFHLEIGTLNPRASECY